MVAAKRCKHAVQNYDFVARRDQVVPQKKEQVALVSVLVARSSEHVIRDFNHPNQMNDNIPLVRRNFDMRKPLYFARAAAVQTDVPNLVRVESAVLLAGRLLFSVRVGMQSELNQLLAQGGP